MDERRLSQLIGAALDNALEQGDLAVGEHLHRALELVLNRELQFPDRRQPYDTLLRTYARMEALRVAQKTVRPTPSAAMRQPT
jgi:hypothetical protein